MIEQVMFDDDGYEFTASIAHYGKLRIERTSGHLPMESISLPVEVGAQLYEFLAREFGPQSPDQARAEFHRLFPGIAA